MQDAPAELDDARSSSAPNLSARAYAALSDMIRRHKLKGGDIVLESRIAESLGVSRTPLREALQRLEGEGLVVKKKAAGPTRCAMSISASICTA